MQKKHIITIAGKPASGKTSTANSVAQHLGYKRFSSGDFVRAAAQKRGMTLADFLALAEADPSIDHEIDDEIRKVSTQDNLVIDSRLAFHWIPESYKVYLDLDMHTAAERLFDNPNDARVASGEAGQNIDEFEAQLIARQESDAKRYQELYDINPYDLAHYDLVVNTKEHPLDNVTSMILSGYETWLKE